MSAACPLFGVTLHATQHDESAERLFERFVTMLEHRGLMYRGRPGPKWDLVVSSEAGQMTELDRQAIIEWLDERPELQHVSVGPLIDMRGE